jgi:hypothetical protein
MLRKLGKTLMFAVAVMGLISTLAVASEMTCLKADDRGCSMATGIDGKEVAVLAAGVKAGDKMECADKGGKMECHKK